MLSPGLHTKQAPPSVACCLDVYMKTPQYPWHRRGHLPLDQAPQSPIQPHPEYSQG